MNYAEIFERCHPAQDRRELQKVLETVLPLEPKIILEIGADRCGTMKVWQEILNPDLMIGIDNTLVEKPSDLNAVILAPMESQRIETFQAVMVALEGNEVDFLHIDGGHTLKEVSADFWLYTRLLKDKACVMVHDIAVSDADPSFCEVQKFWKFIRGYYNTIEIIHGVGTGLIFWEDS